MENKDKGIMKYKKKPVEIEAIEWTGTNIDQIITWCNGKASYEAGISANYLVLTTLESNGEVGTRHAATIGDYIIKGIKGEFYPCKPEIFHETYDLVEDEK